MLKNEGLKTDLRFRLSIKSGEPHESVLQM